MAIGAYRDGLKIDPESKALLEGLAELQPPAPVADVKVEGEAEGAQSLPTNDGDTKMDEAYAKATAPSKVKLPDMGDDELALLTSFFSETSDLERKQQVERIIKFKLNPFEVLQLPSVSTEEEMNTGALLRVVARISEQAQSL